MNTVAPGSPAQVSVSFDGVNVHLTFDTPQGADGAEGAPGEVTQATLNAAIATTAVNPSGVSLVSGSYSDPVSAADLNEVKDKVNELISALVRMP